MGCSPPNGLNDCHLLFLIEGALFGLSVDELVASQGMESSGEHRSVKIETRQSGTVWESEAV